MHHCLAKRVDVDRSRYALRSPALARKAYEQTQQIAWYNLVQGAPMAVPGKGRS